MNQHLWLRRPFERAATISFAPSAEFSDIKVLNVVRRITVALEIGDAFVIVKSDNAKAIYYLCSTWTEYGEITVTPILAASDL